MKKFLNIVLVIIIIAAIGTACFFAYKYFTKPPVDETISKEPIFTEATYPIVDGSTATIPLSKAFKANFTANPDAEVVHATTHNAYVNLIDRKVDLILVTEPSQEELELAAEKGIELEVTPVVREGFVFYVNAENPIESLTLEQIQKIYTGEIKNWSEIGGNPGEIKAYQRPVNSRKPNGNIIISYERTKINRSTKRKYSRVYGRYN